MIWTVSNVVVQIRCSIIWHLDINFNKVWYRIWKRTPGLDKINATFCTIPLRRKSGVYTNTHTLRYHTENYPFTALKSLFSLSPESPASRDIPIYKKKCEQLYADQYQTKSRDQPIYEKFFTPSGFFSIEWKINPRLTRISVDNKIIIWHMPTKA